MERSEVFIRSWKFFFRALWGILKWFYKVYEKDVRVRAQVKLCSYRDQIELGNLYICNFYDNAKSKLSEKFLPRLSTYS